MLGNQQGSVGASDRFSWNLILGSIDLFFSESGLKDSMRIECKTMNIIRKSGICCFVFFSLVLNEF
jgi:hypothetical protein